MVSHSATPALDMWTVPRLRWTACAKAHISRCPHARPFRRSVVQYLTCGGFRQWTIRLARQLKCALFEVRAGHNVVRDLA